MKTLSHFLISLTFVIALIIPSQIWSQCTLACFSEIYVSLDASGNATLTPEMVLVDVPATCGTLTLSQSSFDCSDIGAPIFVTVTDSDSGNSCWFDVIIEDKSAPTIACIANLNISLPPSGTVDLTPAMLLAFENDNCPLTYDINPPSVSCADLGTPVNVFITATDPSGNSVSCFTTVSVSNYNPPALSCFAQVNFSLDASGNATITPDDILASPYPECALLVTPNTVDCTDIGTPVAVTILDQLTGNSCWSTVIVEDKTAPTIACEANVNVTLPLSGSLDLTPAMFIAFANDNCSLTYDISPASVSCADVGSPVTVIVTVTDPGGNMNSCFSTLNVQYSAPPIVCNGTVNISLDASGNATILPEDILDGPYPSCALVVSPNMVDCTDVGLPVFVTVLDQLNGNTCFGFVNVEDKIAPTAICASNINISLGTDGTATLSPAEVNQGSFDNCTSAANLTYSLSQSTFTCADIGGAISVVMEVTDASGNSGVCFTSVLVEDKLAPVPVCFTNINVSLGTDGTATLLPAEVNQGSFDNCTSAINLAYTLSQSVFTCADIGAPVAVQMHVADASGNSELCIFNVWVEDKLAPVLNCNTVATDVQLGADGTVTITPVMVLDSGIDNCDISFTLTPTSFDCGDKNKTKNVTVTAMDASGNTSTCTGSVFIEDPQPSAVGIIPPPSITCGQSGAIFTADVTGGYGPFTYEWTIKGNPNGWSITSGQGTSAITMDVGIKKIKLEIKVTDVCGKITKNRETFNCSSSAISQIGIDGIQYSSPSIDLGLSNAVQLYPNPVMDRIALRIPRDINLETEDIYIIDQLGAKTSLIFNADDYSLQDLDVSMLQPGIYCLVMETKFNERIVKRFVKL